jgi:SAM-dependent methyltransferase
MFRSTAHVYDLIYEAAGKDYAGESAALVALIEERQPRARTLLDVACGTGGHLVHLKDRFEVAGVDLDGSMLEQAGRRLPDVPLLVGDMRTLELGRRFDVVVCLFSSVGYMANTDELSAAVVSMAAHLEQGGVLVVDGWIRPEAWRDPGTVHVECGRDDTTVVARVGRSQRDGNRTRLEMHHLVGTIDGVELLVDEHDLTLFTDDEYRTAFRDTGLEPEVLPGPHADRDRYIAAAPG